MTKRFELQDGNSQKYWEIKTSGKKTVVRYGRIGSDGRVVEKTHDSTAAAKTAAGKLITQKNKKGLPGRCCRQKEVGNQKDSQKRCQQNCGQKEGENHRQNHRQKEGCEKVGNAS